MSNRVPKVPAHRLITTRQSRGIEPCDALRSVGCTPYGRVEGCRRLARVFPSLALGAVIDECLHNLIIRSRGILQPLSVRRLRPNRAEGPIPTGRGARSTDGCRSGDREPRQAPIEHSLGPGGHEDDLDRTGCHGGGLGALPRCFPAGRRQAPGRPRSARTSPCAWGPLLGVLCSGHCWGAKIEQASDSSSRQAMFSQ